MKTFYEGDQTKGRSGSGFPIYVVDTSDDGIMIRRRLLHHVCRHSPDGFAWGYGGSGPSDAALSILTDAAGRQIAEMYYQEFKWQFIATSPQVLSIDKDSILLWLKSKGVVTLGGGK